MTNESNLDLFFVTVPGLESPLREEAIEKGFKKPKAVHGGVTVQGGWQDVWRANLEMRGASRILVRLGEFRVSHLAQLDKRARQFPWAETLRPDIPVRIEVSCKKSKIYHQKAAAQRIETAIAEELGCEISADANVCVKVRIIENVCTISLDSSGEGLHKRGHKVAVNKAPMRETLASLLLRQSGFKGKEPVVDPMCGSGTFIIEAAEIASRLQPGRSRNFAFEQLATFEPTLFQEIRNRANPTTPEHGYIGFDRDNGAIKMANANAERADVAKSCAFSVQTISDLSAPEGVTGLVIVNPPYGARIGEVKKLAPLYQTLGDKLKARFSGWRIAVVTNSDELAHRTGLPFAGKPTAFSHGGIKVKLFVTEPLD